MEALVSMMVAAPAGLACWVLLSPDATRRSLVGVRDMPRLLVRACERMATLPLVATAMGLAPCRVVSSELARVLGRHGIALSDSARPGAVALVVAGVCLCAGLLLWSPVGLLVGLVGSALALPAIASAIERRRRRELVREMPDVFRSLAVALSSGRTLAQAIEYVGTHERGEVGQEFARAALAMRCGSSTDEALAELESRLDVPGMELLATALSISQRTGSPLRGLLLSSAGLAESKAELERSLATKTAQARLSVRIVCTMPVLMVGTLSVLSVEFRAGMLTTTGMVSLGVAALLDGLALFLVRRLMRGVLS